MGFNKDDKLWIEICKNDPDTYRIMIDIDSAYVVDMRIDKMIYKFNLSGSLFAAALLDYVGCSADLV